MKSPALVLAFLAASGAAYADAGDGDLPSRMSLDEEPRERQDVENDRQRPDDWESLTPMEFFYKHSQLEAGIMYTDFGNALSLKSHMGFYVRYGVEILPHVDVHVTYRYNAFGNGPGQDVEDINVQALFLGAGIHVPLHPEFAFVAGAGIGPMWWNSSIAPDALGLGLTGEAALTARLWSQMRLKVGLVLDGVNTDFHQTSTHWSVNLSYLAGFELGM